MTGATGRLRRLGPLWLGPLLVALVVRALVDTDLGRDATLYLWMADRTLAGDPGGLWSTVFHPLHPGSVALGGLLFPDVPLESLGRWIAGLAGAAATVPLFYLGRRVVGDSAATWGCLLYAVGAWFARTPGEAMSEGVYWLLVTWGLLLAGFGSAPRAAAGGVLLGLAYGVHPNAAAVLLVVPVWRWLRQEPAAARAVGIGSGIVVLLLVLGWWIWGPGPVLSAKLAFVWGEGVGGAGAPVAHLGQHLLGLPGAAAEGIGFVALPLALLGLWWHRREGEAPPGGLLWIPFVLLLVPISLLKAHPRFLTSLGILLLPFAGLGLSRAVRWLLDSLPEDQPINGRRLSWALIVLALGSELLRLEVGGPAKPYEQALGVALREPLAAVVDLPEGRSRSGFPPALVTDMPRVAWYAGARPGPPKHRPREEFLQAALRPGTRYVVWMPRRSGEIAKDLQGAGFRFVPTPRLLPRASRDTIEALQERGVKIYRRD